MAHSQHLPRANYFDNSDQPIAVLDTQSKSDQVFITNSTQMIIEKTMPKENFIEINYSDLRQIFVDRLMEE